MCGRTNDSKNQNTGLLEFKKVSTLLSTPQVLWPFIRCNAPDGKFFPIGKLFLVLSIHYYLGHRYILEVFRPFMREDAPDGKLFPTGKFFVARIHDFRTHAYLKFFRRSTR